MKATVLYGPRDVRFEERSLPKIDAIAEMQEAILWIQQAYLKASDTGARDWFGWSARYRVTRS